MWIEIDMKISKIEVQKNNPRRFNLYIDDEFFMGVTEETLIYYNFFENRIIDEKIKEEIQSLEDYNVNLAKAINYASRAMKTEWEVRNYLREKKVLPHQIEDMIKFLVDRELIDDRFYVEQFIEEKINTGRHGLVKIKHLLTQKGISRNLLDDIVDEEQSEMLKDACTEAAQRKYDSLMAANKDKIYEKLFRFLSARGFQYDEIKNAIDKVMAGD